jgi:RNA:NAD 2'-phosphotransferase (TPT1/KptA family)
MPKTSDAQKRASAKWINNNKERVKEVKKKWVEDNRAYVNAIVAANNKKYYWRNKEFAIFRQILLDP